LAAIAGQRFAMSAFRVAVRSAISIATLCLLGSALLGTSAQAQTSTPTRQPTSSEAQHQTPDAQAQPGDDPQVVYSPWTKFCGKDQSPAGAKDVCLTVREARLHTGQLVAGAALIESQGDQQKTFRITLPLGMELSQGVRVAIDRDPPMSGRYIVCLANGCMADFEVGVDFVGKLKKSQNIVLLGANVPGQTTAYPIPLTDFAQANEGPPTDPKKFEKTRTVRRSFSSLSYAPRPLTSVPTSGFLVADRGNDGGPRRLAGPLAHRSRHPI
jgi:invasion protein IalB